MKTLSTVLAIAFALVAHAIAQNGAPDVTVSDAGEPQTRTRTVSGRLVVAADGRGVEGVRLTALDGRGEYGGLVLGETTTDADGAFTFSALPRQRCRLWTWPPEGELADYFCELTVVEGEEDAQDVVVRLWRGSSISGTVEFYDSTTVAHCLTIGTSVTPAANCPPLHRVTPSARFGADGTFAVRGIPPGSMSLFVGNICRLYYPAAILRIEKDGKRIDGPLDLSTARDLDGFHVVVVVSHDYFSGRIVVRGRNRAAVKSLTVTLRPLDPEIRERYTPSPIELARGERDFIVRGLVSGEYELTISAPDARCRKGAIPPFVKTISLPSAVYGRPTRIDFDATCR